MGRVQVYIENISKPTEVSCLVGKGAPADKQTRDFTVVERFRKGLETFSTGKAFTVTAGDFTPLRFLAMPDQAGTYIYTIKAGPLGNASFVECNVRTLAQDSPSSTRGSAKVARGRTRGTPRTWRSGRPAPPPVRIAGARTLRRLSRKALREAGLETRSRQRGPATPTPPASHTFGPTTLTSESKKASVLTAQFYSLDEDRMLLKDGDQLVAMIAVPPTQTAVVDCEVNVFGQPVADDFSITVEQYGGPETTTVFGAGAHHLVFGLNRTMGLETFALRSNGSDTDFWTLTQCEVEFH